MDDLNFMKVSGTIISDVTIREYSKQDGTKGSFANFMLGSHTGNNYCSHAVSIDLGEGVARVPQKSDRIQFEGYFTTDKVDGKYYTTLKPMGGVTFLHRAS